MEWFLYSRALLPQRPLPGPVPSWLCALMVHPAQVNHYQILEADLGPHQDHMVHDRYLGNQILLLPCLARQTGMVRDLSERYGVVVSVI